MKVKYIFIVFFTVILFSIFGYTSTQINEQYLTSLIERVKTAKGDDKRKAMNHLKRYLRMIHKRERTRIMQRIRQSLQKHKARVTPMQTHTVSSPSLPVSPPIPKPSLPAHNLNHSPVRVPPPFHKGRK